MKALIYSLLATACMLPDAQDLSWQSENQAQYLCGGVGDESMQALRAERSASNLSLLFVANSGAYLADVAVTISGNGLSEPVRFTADGPTCLLKLPQGKYRIVASLGGDEQAQNVVVSRGARQTIFRLRHAAES